MQAKGAGAPDAKTACKAMGPDISVTSTLTGTHAAAPNVTHVDIQTVLYRTEPELVDAKKSRISLEFARSQLSLVQRDRV